MGVTHLDTILVERDGIIDDTTIIVVVAIMKIRTKIDFDLLQQWSCLRSATDAGAGVGATGAGTGGNVGCVQWNRDDVTDGLE